MPSFWVQRPVSIFTPIAGLYSATWTRNSWQSHHCSLSWPNFDTVLSHLKDGQIYFFIKFRRHRQWNCSANSNSTWHHNYFMWRGNNRLLQHTEDWTMFICFLNILKFRMKWLTPVEDCGKWFIVWNTSVFSGFNSSLSCLDLSHEILIWGWGFLLFLLLCLWLKV